MRSTCMCPPVGNTLPKHNRLVAKRVREIVALDDLQLSRVGRTLARINNLHVHAAGAARLRS